MIACHRYSRLKIVFQMGFKRDYKLPLTKETCQPLVSLSKHFASSDSKNSIRKKPIESKDFHQIILSKLIDANRKERNDKSIGDSNEEKLFSNENAFQPKAYQLMLEAENVTEDTVQSNLTEVRSTKKLSNNYIK